MIWRFFSYFLCQALPALVAWFVVSTEYRVFGSFAAAFSGALLWLLFDTIRATKVLGWLKEGDVAHSPLRSGMWGEVFDRVRKLVRTRDRAKAESDGRLQDFLAALQASPNGVVLLDANSRIEWFNQTAASHFGFDARRDMLQHFGNLVRDPGFATYYANRIFQSDVVMPGRDSTATKPVKLSVQIHPYGDGRSLLLSRDITAVEQAEAMRRDFVANVSHELRTPLSMLQGYSEAIVDDIAATPEEHKELAQIIYDESGRLNRMVTQLTDLERLQYRAGIW